MVDFSRGKLSEVELNFAAPFGVALRAFRKAAGWTQMRLAVELHRDHTYVSKWETGRLQPDADDLARIVAALALGPTESSLLRNSWMRSTHRGRVPSSDDLAVSLRAAGALRRLGQPRVAYELAARDGRAALERARTAPLPERQLRDLLAVAGDLLLEEVKAALDFATRSEVRAGLLAANMREHRLVSKAVGDRRARSRLAVADEAVRYAKGDIDSAHRNALFLLDEFTVAEPEWFAETIRAVAINAGLLGDDAGLSRAWERFCDIQGDLPEDLRRFALEGFVRGFTTADPDRAFEIVGVAYELINRAGDASAVRRVQLARTEGRLVLHVSGCLADGETRQRVEDALVTSRALDLGKYVGELEGLLDAGAG